MPSPPSASSPIWRNWSKNIEYTNPNNSCDYYFTPRTQQQLRVIVTNAVIQNKSVRVSGQRHSQPPLVISDNRESRPDEGEWLIDLSCYSDLGPQGMETIVIGSDRTSVTVNAGVREDQLDAFLTANQLMLKTVTAGGFFSLGGISAVDVHGATIQAPIFAETVLSFEIMNADGVVEKINEDSDPFEGIPPLRFARVSLGMLGVVTSVTIGVLERPCLDSLRGAIKMVGEPFAPARDQFLREFPRILQENTRVESFFNPYTEYTLGHSFLVLCWNIVERCQGSVQGNSAAKAPPDACALAAKGEFGLPELPPFEEWLAEDVARVGQEEYLPLLAAGYTAVGMGFVFQSATQANRDHAALWIREGTRVILMSYFIPIDNLERGGLEKVWEALDAVRVQVRLHGMFHTVVPVEFRFVKSGTTAMSGAFSEKDEHFVNLDLVGYTEPNVPAKQYPDKLLKFFATIERKWWELGGLPHQGKMFGFYDPEGQPSSFTPPFNPNFFKYVLKRREQRGAPIQHLKKYRQKRDPEGRFLNKYLKILLDLS